MAGRLISKDRRNGVGVVKGLALVFVAAGRFGLGMVRRWSLLLPLTVAGLLAWRIAGMSWALRAALVGAVLAVLGSWWVVDRGLLVRWVWLPWRAWWRRWFLYGPVWWWWMGRLGLTLHDELTGTSVRPRLVRVRCTAATDRLLVTVPVGFTVDHITAQVEALANAAKAPRAMVREVPGKKGRGNQVGRVWLEFERRDPLHKTITALPVPTNRDGSPRLNVKDLDGLVIGRNEDGSPWRLKLRGNHILVVGVTGSGKASVIWSVLRALAPFIRAGLVVVHGIDPKGGMELEFGAELFERYERDDFADMVGLLERDATDMDARCRALRGTTRTFEPTTATPLVLIIVDELATLTALLPERKLMARAEAALGLLLTKGRAPGYVVLGEVQDPSKEIVSWRQLFPTKVAFRLDEAIQVDMTLGEGVRERGAYADHISESLPGVGYVKIDGRKEPARVRAAYVSDDEIKAMAREYAAPTGTGYVPDDASELAEVSNVPEVPTASATGGLDGRRELGGAAA